MDSFRLERSPEDEKKVLMGWKRLAEQGDELMPLDRVVLGFLRDYWGAALPSCSRPEVDLLGRVFSPGIREQEPLAEAVPPDGQASWSRSCPAFWGAVRSDAWRS